jgi:hypothetical protein
MKNKEELISNIVMQKNEFQEKEFAPETGDMSAEDFAATVTSD